MSYNKLKDMEVTSVDLVKRGANPDADIKLFKSFDGVPEDEPVKKSFWARLGQGIAKALSNMDELPEEDILKSEEETRIEKAESTMIYYTGALEDSFSSIMKDNTLSGEERQEMLIKSLGEFSDTVTDDIIKACGGGKPKKLGKTTKKPKEMEEIDEMKIDKSRLTAEEATALESLLAKAAPKLPAGIKVEIEEEDDDMEEMPPQFKKALTRMEELTKSLEMKEFEEIAKKYETLGENTSELANTLYDLKKNSPKYYDSYVQILDKSLAAASVNNSGIFGEIGKSYSGGSVAKSTAVGKIESIAKGFMEKDPTMDRNVAMMKAWEEHPELAVEYEQEVTR